MAKLGRDDNELIAIGTCIPLDISEDRSSGKRRIHLPTRIRGKDRKDISVHFVGAAIVLNNPTEKQVSLREVSEFR
jgi:hypothetical protein